VILDAGAGYNSYSWNGGLSASQQFTVSQQGNYSVVVTNTNNCSNSDTVFVTVNQKPSISLGNDVSVCQGNSVILDAGAGYNSYSWNGGLSSSQQYIVNQQGNYSVVVTNTNNCSNSDTVFVTVNQNPTISLIAPTYSACSNGQAFTLTATPQGGNYSGTGINQSGVFNPLIANIGTNKILYEFTNSNGCYAKDSLEMEVFQKPSVSLALTTTSLCSNSGTISLSGGLPTGGAYLGNGVISGNSFDPIVSGTGTQTITYSYTDVNGCSDNSSDFIVVDVCNGIATFQNSQIILYPNPANEFIHINNLPFNSSIVIFDAMGKEVIKTSNDDTKMMIDISELSSGIYFINITQYSDINLFNFKIIKK
jgi:hypothetical protein